MEEQVADEGIVDGEGGDVHPEDARPGEVFFVGAALPLARGLDGPLEPVEHSEANERHQVDMVLEKREGLTDRLPYGLLLLGKIGQKPPGWMGDYIRRSLMYTSYEATTLYMRRPLNEGRVGISARPRGSPRTSLQLLSIVQPCSPSQT
jgi:hypothetical protein